MASAWQTSDPDEDWDAFKESYWDQATNLRSPHVPPPIVEPPPLLTTHVQIVGYIAKTSMKYNKYGDMGVTITIPAQYVSAAHRLYGLSDRLLSVDLVALPELDMDVPLEEQLDGEWWK